jgi:hypothetical protein
MGALGGSHQAWILLTAGTTASLGCHVGMRRSAAGSRRREPLGPYPSAGNWPFEAREAPVPAFLPPGSARALGRDPCGCTVGHADGRLRPGHGTAAGWEGAPVTRRLLLVAAVAVILGLVATPVLDETAIGGWFGLPWDGSRGRDQPGQQHEPTAPSPTTNQQGGNFSHRSAHAGLHPRGRGPKLRRSKGKPDTAGRPARPPARDLHAPPRPRRR